MANATVTAASTGKEDVFSSTNEEGSFILVLEPGKYKINASFAYSDCTEDGMVLGPAIELTVTERPMQAVAVPIRLFPRVLVKGRVFNSSGMPIPGAAITVECHSTEEKEQGLERFRVAKAVSDVAGNFTILTPLVPGEYDVSASHEEYQSIFGDLEGLTFKVTDQPERQEAFFTIRFSALRPTGTIEGVVMDGDRRPVSGARVQVEGDGITYSEGTTDDKGAFKCSGEGSGWVTICVLHPNYKISRKEIGFINPRSEPNYRHTGVIIQLAQAEFRIQGVLKDTRGKIRRNRAFLIYQWDNKDVQLNQHVTVRTDADGKFEFSAAPDLNYGFSDEDGNDLIFESTPPPRITHPGGMVYAFERTIVGAELRPWKPK